jgi:hypothetical protein
MHLRLNKFKFAFNGGLIYLAKKYLCLENRRLIFHRYRVFDIIELIWINFFVFQQTFAVQSNLNAETCFKVLFKFGEENSVKIIWLFIVFAEWVKVFIQHFRSKGKGLTNMSVDEKGSKKEFDEKSSNKESEENSSNVLQPGAVIRPMLSLETAIAIIEKLYGLKAIKLKEYIRCNH